MFLGGPAYAIAPTAKLVVGAMHAPPFAIHTDDGQWSGLSVELVRQVAQTLGVEEAINRAVLHIIYSAAWKGTVQRYIEASE